MDAKPVVVGGGLRRSKILSSAVPGWSMRLTSHPGVTTAANLINLRRASTARGYGSWFVCPSFGLSVCYHVFCDYVQEMGKRVILMGSLLHRLDFKIFIRA